MSVYQARQPSPVPLAPCLLRALERRRSTQWAPSPEPCILYLVPDSDLSRTWLQEACTPSRWRKQSKFHRDGSSLESPEQRCHQPRELTCSGQVAPDSSPGGTSQSSPRSTSLSLSLCSWQLEAFWEGQLGSWVESVRKANGNTAKVILKNRVGNPVTGEVTEMVLTFILWKPLPLISA